jgi:SRSO17 transposase
MEETAGWEAELDRMLGRMAPHFKLEPSRERLAAYVRGLLADVQRKNGWQLAEQAGDRSPEAMQQFLYRGTWDPDAISRETRAYVMESLGDPDGVLVGDETGILKKGTRSVGVQRQYSGTAGRVENCQIAVLLGYVSRHGRALMDRELYLPEKWTQDPARCRVAGVPEDVTFRTKPELLWRMVERALAEGVPFGYVTADTVYGDNTTFRSRLERRRLAYVLGTSVNDAKVPINLRLRALRSVIEQLPADGWQRLSAGTGSQGERWYDWQHVDLSTTPDWNWCRSLLIRRSITDPSEIRAFRCFHPVGTPLATLVRVAGCRWTIETDIEEAKGEVGLDQYEVRTWPSWYRHMSLVLLAYSFLAVMKARGSAADLAAIKGGAKTRKTTMAAFRASRGLSSP